MQDDDRDSGASTVILSFLLGGLTGAALAVLFAPRSGSETREILGQKWREGEVKAREVKEAVTVRSKELLNDAQGYIDRQREGVEQTKERLAAAVEAGKQAYREEKQKS